MSNTNQVQVFHKTEILNLIESNLNQFLQSTSTSQNKDIFYSTRENFYFSNNIFNPNQFATALDLIHNQIKSQPNQRLANNNEDLFFDLNYLLELTNNHKIDLTYFNEIKSNEKTLWDLFGIVTGHNFLEFCELLKQKNFNRPKPFNSINVTYKFLSNFGKKELTLLNKFNTEFILTPNGTLLTYFHTYPIKINPIETDYILNKLGYQKK